MSEMTDASSAGPSAWERDLYAHLSSHVEREAGLLQAYTTAAEASPSRALRYLANLLIDDEVRHHQLFTELAESLENDALLRSEDPAVPYLDFDRASNRDAVIDIADQLLQGEQADAQELRRLRRELREVKDTSLWSLLVDVMERDTQKHIAILRFVKKRDSRHEYG